MEGTEAVNSRIARYHFNRINLNLRQAGLFGATLKKYLRWKLTGKLSVPSRPLILMVEPTNRCNYRCPLCDKGSGKLTRPEGDMSLDNFTNLLNMAGDSLKMLMLWNQGEPLLNHQLPDMIAQARSRGIFTVVSTNGSLLERKWAGLIDSGLDELIISLDGIDPSSYKKYRRGGNFQEVTEGIKAFAASRGKRFKPLISLQFLLLKENIDNIGEFEILAKELGADRVLLKTVQVANERQAEEYLPHELKFTRYSDHRAEKTRRRRFDCRKILYSAVIDWNGNMVPCCFDKNEDFVMGNVFADGLVESWNGEKFRVFRENIAAGKRPPMCYNCTEGLEKLFLR